MSIVFREIKKEKAEWYHKGRPEIMKLEELLKRVLHFFKIRKQLCP